MFKFLRRYNKLILSVGGVMLMITFLIPQAFSRMARDGGSHSVTIATLSDNEKMTGADLEHARRELQVLEKYRQGVPGLGRIDKAEQWFLLVREAKKAGLVPTATSATVSDEQIAATGERDPDLVRQAIANLAGVSQLVRLYQTNGLYSDRRLKNAAERLLHNVQADTVVIEAQASKADADPTDEQIRAQFDTYADVLPGTAGSPFGYKLPNRLKLEWLGIPAESVREVVRTSPEFDNVALRLHWKKNESKKFPDVDPNAPVPEVVRTDLLDKLTAQKIREITDFAANQLRLNQHGLQLKDGWVVLPPNWEQRMLDFEKLAADIQAKFPGLALPAYEAVGDSWLTIPQLNSLPGIGAATTTKVSSRPMTLAGLAALDKEFGGDGVIAIQKDIAGPALTDAEGNTYLFRITDAQAAHKPASIDEVRASVAADLRKVAHYEKLAAELPQIEKLAETDGLLKAAMAYETVVQPQSSIYICNPFYLMQRLQIGQKINDLASPLPVIGMNRPAVQSIVEYALTLPRKAAIDTLPESSRVMSLPVKDKLAVMVVRLNSASPLTQEEFANLTSQGVIQYLISNEEADTAQAVQDAFSFETLEKRNKFAFVREQTKSEDAADKDATAKKSAQAN